MGNSMKNFLRSIVLILILFNVGVQAQGSVVTPYDSVGWDAAAEYTSHYGLRIFELLSNPGGLPNRNMRDIDSLMYELVVYTDSVQLEIENDTLKFSNSMSGMSAFTGTEQYDTVLVSGLDSSDVVVVSPRENVPGANDILGARCLTDTLICQRPASGTSGLKWNWIWIRKY